jgi:hypothetical protein
LSTWQHAEHARAHAPVRSCNRPSDCRGIARSQARIDQRSSATGPPASNAKHVFGSRSRLENRETQDHHLHVFAAMWSFPSMPPCAGPHSSGWAADSCGRGLPQRRHKPAGKRRQAQASASKRRQRSSATGTGRMSTRAGTGTHHCTHARAATGTGRAPRCIGIHRCPGCNLHCLQEISQPPAKGRALVGPDLPRG